MASTLASTVEAIKLVEKEENHTTKTLFKATFDETEKIARFKFPRLTLCIEVSGNLLKTNIDDSKHSFHRNVIDPLRQHVRFIVNAANSGKVPKDSEAFIFVVFEALEAICDVEIDEDDAQRASVKGWKSGENVDYEALINNRAGLDTSSVVDTAFHHLKKTPEQVCRAIREPFRITHIESILRTDHARRFEQYKRQLEQDLHDEDLDKLRHSMPPFSKLAKGKMLSSLKKEDIVNDMITPRVTYHGTPLRNVSSIVRHGFKKPGSRILDPHSNSQSQVVASPRSGIAFDRGIYSSEVPWYALAYAKYEDQTTPLGDIPTMRLFVCATIMGRTLTQNKGVPRELIHGPAVKGFDSHYDNSHELIVHKDAAILPCYVIHLDLGAEAAKRAILCAQADRHNFERSKQTNQQIHPKLIKDDAAPGDAERAAAEMKATALKHFPMGFGPAGRNFVIEEVAPTDDDEENHGKWYQYKSSLDQYQDERREK